MSTEECYEPENRTRRCRDGWCSGRFPREQEPHRLERGWWGGGVGGLTPGSLNPSVVEPGTEGVPESRSGDWRDRVEKVESFPLLETVALEGLLGL